MRFTFAAVAGLSLAACASVSESTDFQPDFSGQVYNSVAASYMARPTFASVARLSDGAELLRIEVDDYGQEGLRGNEYVANPTVSFRRQEVPDYVAMIDKYAEWRGIALKDGDMISKVIGRVPTYNGALQFGMHSGNETSHKLWIEFCAIGTCVNRLYFDADNAMRLRQTLERFGSGELAPVNLDSKYQ